MWFIDRIRCGIRAQGGPRLRDAAGTVPIREDAVVADFHEPRRKDVEAEAAKELLQTDGHHFAAGAVRVVLVREVHGAGFRIETEDARLVMPTRWV